MIDLNPNHIGTVKAILAEHVPECEVRAFGSRATWTAKDYSDLDLAIVCGRPLDWATLGRLKEAFEESDLPMRVDVLDWHSISQSFREVIERDYEVVKDRAIKQPAGRGWRKVMLGDLIGIKHGFAFKGVSIHDEPQGDVLLTPGNFAIGGGFKRDKFKYYDGSVPEGFVLHEGDLLVTMTDLSKQSDTLGYPALVPASTDGHRYLHNQRLGKVLPRDNGEICKRYIYYVMCSVDYRHEVLASATGTTVKHTSPDRIKQYRFSLPPLPEQRTIAQILGTLDDKIELNRQLNETLEELARAIFKDWFVDFGPVRAKLEGRDTGLPEHLAALFPDRLVESELGEIPEGWEVKPVTALVSIVGGGTPKTSVDEYWGGDIPWFSVVDTPPPGSVYVVMTEKTITQKGLQESSARLVPAETTIISARGTVGNLAMCGRPMAFNQSCYGLRTSSDVGDYFVFLTAHNLVDRLQAMAHGSVFSTITRQTIEAVSVAVAPRAVHRAFEATVQPFFSRIRVNVEESRILSQLRDVLLPKLVSGEMRVGVGSP